MTINKQVAHKKFLFCIIMQVSGFAGIKKLPQPPGLSPTQAVIPSTYHVYFVRLALQITATGQYFQSFGLCKLKNFGV